MKAFDNVLGEMSSIDMSVYNMKHGKLLLTNNKRNFHKYSSVMEVILKVNEYDNHKKKPVSLILLQEDGNDKIRIFAVVQDYNTVVEIKLGETTEPKHKFGFYYYSYSLEDDPMTLDWTKHVIAGKQGLKLGFVLLLPLVEENNTKENCLFAMVSSNWKSLTTMSSLKLLRQVTT